MATHSVARLYYCCCPPVVDVFSRVVILCSLALIVENYCVITDAKYADGVGCCDPESSGTCDDDTNPAHCFSVYHSCSVPLKITGTIPRDEYVCPGQPSDFPTAWNGTSATSSQNVQVSVVTPGVYRQESSVWRDGMLVTVPQSYQVDHESCDSPSASSAAVALSGTAAAFVAVVSSALQ